jgi:hypothetical protein
MIKSVWKPISKKSKINHYQLVDNEAILNRKGTTGYKVIWVCDGPNCRTPNLTHSISACHLIKDKMCYETQICRPCQCSGEGNGRYGDNRKWGDFFDENKLNDLKIQYSNKWKGDLNPSKKDEVKNKKNQLIINRNSIEKICNNFGFKLIELLKLDGKRSIFKVECEHGHISEKRYTSFTKTCVHIYTTFTIRTVHACIYAQHPKAANREHTCREDVPPANPEGTPPTRAHNSKTATQPDESFYSVS